MSQLTAPPSPSRPSSRMASIIALGIFASPAAAFWSASRNRAGRIWPWLRWGGVSVVMALAVFLLRLPMAWQKVALLWSFGTVFSSTLIALLVPPKTVNTAKASASFPRSLAEPWARRTILAALPLVIIMPSIHAIARLSSWVLLGDLLVQLNARATDPKTALSFILLEALWTIPCGLVFVALSQRRGKLNHERDVAVALGSWFFLLLAWEIICRGGFGALRSQLLNAPGFREWGLSSGVVIYLGFVAAMVPLALFLAWGSKRGWVRMATVVVLLSAGFLNLGLAIGSNAIGQFVTARIAERSGEVDRALRWYESSLKASDSPKLAPFLHHRIGLLRYKTGDLEGARESFRSLVTDGDADSELHRQASHFLERFSLGTEGRRVVLPGVEVRTQRRSAYCAPNTLALVFGYLGHRMGVTEFAEEATLLSRGTSLSSIVRMAELLDLDHYLVSFATLDDVRWIVDQGLPALLYTPGHVSAVLGYDETLGTLVKYDTAKWDIWVDLPYADVEKEWGQRSFLLGVVVPREETEVTRAVRERFATPWAAATWQWWLSVENYSNEAWHLRKALEIEPTFFPAAFGLVVSHDEDEVVAHPFHLRWLKSHAHMPEVLSKARAALSRPWSDRYSLATGLAAWYQLNGDYETLLQLAENLKRTDQDALVQPFAGIASAKLGRWQQAVSMLEDMSGDEDELSVDALEALIHSYLALDRREAATDAVTELSNYSWDDRMEWTLKLANMMAPQESPVFLEDIYESYLWTRNGDAETYIRLAELTLKALEEEPDSREERLARARSSATIASVLARTEEVKDRSEALLAEVQKLVEGPYGQALALN